MRALGQADVLRELDSRVVSLCRERGPLRAVLARIAACLVAARTWERIGYARLSDYAAECLGLSARSVRSLAQVGEKLDRVPRLEHALVTGALGWTKVRLLAQLPREEDAGRWIAFARRVTAERLSKEVRAVDRGSVEAGAAEEPGARGRLFEVRCTPETRRKWVAARGAAARAAGRMLHISEAAELIAAEVLSSLPIGDQAADAPCHEAATSWSQATEAEDAAEDAAEAAADAAAEPSGAGSASAVGPAAGALRPPWRERSVDPPGPPIEPARAHLPPALQALVEGLDEADAFELDERFRRAHALERRLDARVGPLLVQVWERWVHRALGFATRDAYARERLGMDPTRARTLVRLERAAIQSPAFARAHRAGALSGVKAGVLEPLVRADPLGRFVEGWVAWAERVTVRRLREDVERALALSETEPAAFRRCGGLPAEAVAEREIGAAPSTTAGEATAGDREIGAGRGGTARGGTAEHEAAGGREIGAGSRATRGNAAGDDREIGAPHRDSEGHMTAAPWGLAGLGTGALQSGSDIRLRRDQGPPKSAPDESCWARFFGPADTVQLFRSVLCTVRRRMGGASGRLPTAGRALDAMLDHALSSWDALDGKVAARHRVFARDGWRCAVPGCSSMQNLHDHHIRFRSAGGSDALENRVTLCAFHHLRGVHAGRLRCVGQAPGGLRWELGIRPGVTPLLAYRSGDLLVPVRRRDANGAAGRAVAMAG